MFVFSSFVTSSFWFRISCIFCFSPNFSYKVHVGLFYRPPSSPSVSLDLLYTSLQDANICNFSNFILLGDLNINYSNPSHPYFYQLCNLINTFSLVQVVPEPTHTSPSGSTLLIDLVMISNCAWCLPVLYCPPKVHPTTTVYYCHWNGSRVTLQETTVGRFGDKT